MPSRPALLCSMEQRLTTVMVDGDRVLHSQSHDGGEFWPGQFRSFGGLVPPGGGVGATSLGLAGGAAGKVLHMAARRTTSGRVALARSEDYGRSWGDWRDVGTRTILGSPVVVAEGDRVFVAARSTDRRCYLIRSHNRGGSWLGMNAVGEGLFETGPAVVAGDGGDTVILVARGLDDRFWMARSRNAGSAYELAWAPIPHGIFRSAPAATLTADLSLLVVAGLGTDSRIWWNRSPDLGASWVGWQCTHPEGGTFLTGPSVATDWNGGRVWLTAVSSNGRVAVAGSRDRGRSWAFGFHLVAADSFQDPA